jgi:hypothetical protein
MMDAIGKKYAVHEIVWRPSPEGLTAELVLSRSGSSKTPKVASVSSPRLTPPKASN